MEYCVPGKRINTTVLCPGLNSTLYIHTAPLFQVELEKDGWEQVACFGVRVLRTFDYPTTNLNPHY